MLSNFPKVTQRELAEQELPSEETVLAACVQTEQEKRRAPLAGPRGAEWGATAGRDLKAPPWWRCCPWSCRRPRQSHSLQSCVMEDPVLSLRQEGGAA